jgi:hypothetical protein
MHHSNHTENNYYLIRKNATALQPNVFLSGMQRLLVTNKGQSAHTPAKVNCKHLNL